MCHPRSLVNVENKKGLRVWNEQSLKAAHFILCNTREQSQIHRAAAVRWQGFGILELDLCLGSNREFGCHGPFFIAMTHTSRQNVMRPGLLVYIITLGSVSPLHAQSASPTGIVSPPKAIYTPAPIYRPEWARQGLTGKGVVLVTIDKETGKVSGARTLQSTGSKLLDGSALEAYSQWRFEPGSVSQVKMPIEFTNRPQRPMPSRSAPQPTIVYALLILLGLAGAVMAIRKRRRT